MMKCSSKILSVLVVTALTCAAAANPLPAPGMTFSVGFQGPTAGGFPGPNSGIPDGWAGIPIDEGSILTPAMPGPIGPNSASLSPLPPPAVLIGATPGAPGIYPGGLGIFPGIYVGVELDALSYGRDRGEHLAFSVDEFAIGIMVPSFPSVASEGAMGWGEASADVFLYTGPAPTAPRGLTFGNIGIIDGDGMSSPAGAIYPGTGLIEPNPATPGALPDRGDNLDAVDMDTLQSDMTGPIYFSLSAAFPDPLEPFPANDGTAMGNNCSGADVLVSMAGGLPMVYASASMLGLDIQGFDTDDLDALALLEDGDGIFTPGVDMILFSVRRGSAVIGMPDSMYGMPIEPGDILTLPVPAAGPAGGSPYPAIYVPAEAMGLATIRSGVAGQFGSDDLDALDMVPIPEPATLSLLAFGGLALIRRRRK